MAYNSNITINKSYITVQSLIAFLRRTCLQKKLQKTPEKVPKKAFLEPLFTCSNTTTKTPDESVKSVQS